VYLAWSDPLWSGWAPGPVVIPGPGVTTGAAVRRLLSIAHDQYRKPEFQVRFSWRPGSVAFWDNRAAVHYAVRNYGDFPRLLERILIADEPQYADL
jgi:alpha-ketoglutarate-dependent taurine dioxygenase